MSCVFCSLLLDDKSVDWVAKEEHAAAFLPLPTSSLAPGHTLVIPTAHTPGVHEAGAASLTATTALIQKVSLAMRETLGAPGVNVLSASGPASEQSVPHLHFHVVPRWEYDGFTTWPSGRSLKKIAEDPARLLADALRGFDAGELRGPAG
jgi:histidine triad (HIT) family protein